MRAALAIALLASSAHADDAATEPPARNSLVIAPRVDALSKTIADPPVPASHALGIGVHYLFDFPPRSPFFAGVGIDLRVLGTDWNDIGATSITAVGKVTAGHAPPLTLELDAGAIMSSTDAGAVLGGGVFLSMFYVEIGYTYQHPLGLDEHPWLGRHQLTLRGIIPVLTR